MTPALITNFESMDHATLLAKLAGVRGDLIYESGDRLFAAYQKILNAARTLQLKRDGVVWDGPSATAFGAWAQQLVTSAYQLAEFARFQSSQLQTAGTEMTNTVSSFPPVPTEAIETLQALTAHADVAMALDPAGTTTAIQQREQQIAQDHQEAVGAMRRLAATYLALRDSINTYPRPEFNRAEDVFLVGGRGEIEDPDDFGASVSLVSAAAVGAAGQTSLAGETPSGNAMYKSGATAPNTGSWSANPGTGIVPPVPASTSYAPGVLPQSANLAQFPAAQVPTAAQTPSPAVPPRTSPATGLDAVSSTGPSAGDGISGGTVVGKAALGASQGSGGSLHGGIGVVSGGVTGTTVPSRPGTTNAEPRSGRSAPRSDAVVGGTPRSGHAVPEERRGGNGRVGGPMGAAGAPGPVTGGTTSRGATQRPPLGVPGGTVGGAPRGTPGARREFTPGGSGLRTRDATTPQGASSTTAHGTAGRPASGPFAPQPAGPDRSRRSRDRADYLEEEEETWVGRRGDTVPPVVG